ncbi:MAG: hypothetical protein J0M29_17170 [Chitinophagales bacterium]|nr:hypothetical protein [Chitinophagales bacterium]
MTIRSAAQWLPLFFLCLLPGILLAQDYSGQYTGSLNGDAVTLSLKGSGANYTGELYDGSNRYTVQANILDKKLNGTCTEVNLGFSFGLAGVFQGNTLNLQLSLLGITQEILLQKNGTQTGVQKPTTQASADRKQRDPALVGKWTRQENYNSGYGGGSMSNESSLVFHADGRVADGGSRTVVGGSDYSGSSSSGGNGIVAGLTWHTENQQLYLTATENGQTQIQCLGKYGFHENVMMITAQDGTKVLFYRN